MNIRILELIEGAQAATGLTVIIDVFRAMTVEAYVIENGAKDLIPIGDIEQAGYLGVFKYVHGHGSS